MSIRRQEVEKLFIGDIVVADRHRAIDDQAVTALAESMKSIGLKTPISIRSPTGTDAVLVAGAHRLEAAKRLGWDEIECIVLDLDPIAAEMWELSENLHRSELSVLERSEHIAAWVQLSEQQVSAQVAPKPNGGRPEGGKRRAARELNTTRDEVGRAVKIASLSEKAKQAARKTGANNNQSVLLAAARMIEPDKQVEVIRTRVTIQKDGDHDDGEHRASVVTRIRKAAFAIDRVLEEKLAPADRAWVDTFLGQKTRQWISPAHNSETGELLEPEDTKSTQRAATRLDASHLDAAQRGESEEGQDEPGTASVASSSLSNSVTIDKDTVVAIDAGDVSPHNSVLFRAWSANVRAAEKIIEDLNSSSNPGDPLPGEAPGATPPAPASGADLSDPAPKASAEGAAAASVSGQGAPAASSNLSSDDWANSPEVRSAPEMPSFLRRTA